MTSQNTKNLTIPQIKRLIENHGVPLTNSPKGRAGKPTEYCLEALNAALCEKLEAKANKYLKSQDAITAQVNAYMAAPQSNAFPPPMPVMPKPNYKALPKPLLTGEDFDAAHSLNIPNKPDFNRKSFKFNLAAPLWKIEKLSLDDRISIFGKVYTA